MRRRLGSVADEDRALFVRPRDELLDRVDRPERVRHLVRGDDLDVPLRRDTVERGKIELALLGKRDHRELRSRTPRDVLPGNEVRVMLELADDDEVAGAEIVQAPRIRDEVDRLRRVAYEDDLTYVGRVQQGAHLLPARHELPYDLTADGAGGTRHKNHDHHGGPGRARARPRSGP